jgi:hypothetical protein
MSKAKVRVRRPSLRLRMRTTRASVLVGVKADHLLPPSKVQVQPHSRPRWRPKDVVRLILSVGVLVCAIVCILSQSPYAGALLSLVAVVCGFYFAGRSRPGN